MSIYSEINPMPEYRTQFGFKGKGEDIPKVNIPSIA